MRKESLKKVQACTGFKPLTSAKPVQRSNNLTNKPTGSRSLNWFVINPWQDDDGEVMNNEMGALREFNLVEDTCISSPQNKNAKWKSPSTRRLEVKQPRIKKQIRTSTRWINHPGLVHTKFYSRHWLIQSFIYVCRIIRGGDVGWGLKQMGIIVKAFFPWKGGLIRGGGLNRGFKILSLLFFLPLRCQKKECFRCLQCSSPKYTLHFKIDLTFKAKTFLIPDYGLLRSRYENAAPNLCWVFYALLGVLCN